MNESGKTAIERKTLSQPMRWLAANAHLERQTRRLDYGCGKGYDADTLGFAKFDINHFPTMPRGKFGIITCNYVLNVIKRWDERQAVVEDIISRLTAHGTAYISVRNDVEKLNGMTALGTWQGYVTPPEPFTLLREVAGYRLYVYKK